MESRPRRKIREAVEAKGHEIEFLEWEPIGGMVEMQGREGGWSVFLKGGGHFGGFSWRDAVDYAEKYLEPQEVPGG